MMGKNGASLNLPPGPGNRHGVLRVIVLPAEMQVLYLITGQSRKGLAFVTGGCGGEYIDSSVWRILFKILCGVKRR
jgi:hypothetical protein